jgi:multiple sugar transport system substrate-binding protein
VLVAACGSAATPTAAPAAPPTKPAEAPKPAEAGAAKPAAEPTKPAAAEPTKPAAEPTKPAAAAATATPAAAKPAAAGQPVTVTMWKGPHKPAGDETKLYARPTLEKFEAANPNIKVDFSEVPWGQYNEKFTAAFAANSGPDLSYQTESFPRFVNAGQILVLDDLMKGSKFDREFFYPRMWETATYGGKVYSVPWITGGSNLFWNKELFEKAGLAPDKPPDTVDDFLSAAQKMTKGDVYGFAVAPREWHENGQWPRRFGGEWFDKDYAKCTIDSPEAVKGFQFLTDLFFKAKVAMPGAVAAQEPGVLGYFRDGKVGMITGQNTLANTVRKQKPDFKLGAARVPKGPAAEPQGRAAYGGVGMLAIAKATKVPDQSWTLSQWLVTPDALKMWIGGLGFMSVSPKVNYYPDDPILSAAQETLQYTFFWPYRGWVFKFWDIESSGIESFLLGQRPVEEAVKDMAKKISDLLQAEGNA